MFLFLLSLLGSVLGLAGGIAFLFLPYLSKLLNQYAISLAAGVLLTTSLIGLFPKAVHLANDFAFLIVLLGFLLAFAFEHFAHLHHHKQDCPKSDRLVILGDTIHNFVDGVSIAAAFLASRQLGVVLAISTFMHELPHEIADFGILVKSGWKRKHVLLINFVSSLTTFVGAYLTYWLIPSKDYLGVLVSIATGLFLYLGASDFLPQISHHREDKGRQITVFLLGCLLMLLVFNLIPHSH